MLIDIQYCRMLFTKQENKLKYIFYFATIVLVLSKIMDLFILYFKNEWYTYLNLYVPIVDFAVVFGLTYSYFKLTILMKKEHLERYN